MGETDKELHWFDKLPEEESKPAKSVGKQRSEREEKSVEQQVNMEKYERNAQQWIVELSEKLNIETEKEAAWNILRAVLHAIRDRLAPEELFHLSAQLPMLVRGAFFEGYHYTGKPEKFHVDELKNRIEKVLPSTMGSKDIPKVFQAVLLVLYDHISKGELDDVYTNMPQDIKQLWDDSLPQHLL